jgi:hypothetical protein
MTPDVFLKTIIVPTAEWLPTIGVNLDFGDRARVELLAISGIEASWSARVQGGGGPAHGLWQFEGGPMSGTAQVMLHAPSQLGLVCEGLGLAVDRNELYNALIVNDRLACVLARLLLWTDPKPLPALGDEAEGWHCYVRNWHPGAPRPNEWPEIYKRSLAAVVDATTATS